LLHQSARQVFGKIGSLIPGTYDYRNRVGLGYGPAASLVNGQPQKEKKKIKKVDTCYTVKGVQPPLVRIHAAKIAITTSKMASIFYYSMFAVDKSIRVSGTGAKSKRKEVHGRIII
jgi:hypothetical protein